MKAVKNMVMVLAVSLLSACSSMNNEFSCNLTAGDACMSLDEVNAKTERNVIRVIPKEAFKSTLSRKTTVRRVWVSPFTDSRGVQHKGGLVYVPELSEELTA
jgi:hypothetical protein